MWIASCHNNLLLSSPPDRWFELAKRPALIFTLRAAPPISILIDSDTSKRWAGREGGDHQESGEWAGQGRAIGSPFSRRGMSRGSEGG